MFTKLLAKVVGTALLLGMVTALGPVYASAAGPGAGRIALDSYSVSARFPSTVQVSGYPGPVTYAAQYSWSGGSGCCNNFQSWFTETYPAVHQYYLYLCTFRDGYATKRS